MQLGPRTLSVGVLFVAALSAACGKESPMAPSVPATTEGTGVITVADQIVKVVEPPTKPSFPCVYDAAPIEIVRHWHHTTGEIAVTATGGCEWTVEQGSGWLKVITPRQGSGSGTIGFALPTYTEKGSRRMAVVVRWLANADKQNVWITQEGCSYGMSAVSQAVPVKGSKSSVSVFSDPVSPLCTTPCPWTAISDSKWVRVVSTSPLSGDNNLTYEVDENTTGKPRVGTIQVGDMTFYVKQSGS